jgi:hypothetical protein
MLNVANFINLLGENYYLDFIIEPFADEVNYEKHFVLVHYQDKKYYEQTPDYIKIRQNEIIHNVKSLFQKSLSDIYLEVSKKKNSEIDQFLNFNIEAVRGKLLTLKNDFYIENKSSNYYTVLYDDVDTQTLETFYSKRENSDFTTNVEYKSLLQNLNTIDDNKLFFCGLSDYFLEFHYQRFKLLSLLPFKLFHIAQSFIIELNKIKSLNTMGLKEQSTEKSTNDTYFKSFLELLDDSLVLKKSTAIGVMINFKRFIQEIKSETLHILQSKGENRNDYLNYLINEIEKQDYIKVADISIIKSWLEEYQISIEDIMNRNYSSNSIAQVIDSHYDDMEPFSPAKDKAFIVQSAFRDYFCKYYADELITMLNGFKNTTKSMPMAKVHSVTKPFKEDYLIAFCKEISNERDIYQSSFIQCYDFGIKSITEYLKSEITENILILPSDKIKAYLDFVEDKIKNTPYFTTSETVLNKWITKYNLDNIEFPYLLNKEVNQLIAMSVNFHQLEEDKRALMEDIQLDFYYYAAMIEGNKIIKFLETKNPKSAISSDNKESKTESENANQLTVNQAIILLDKLGVFSDKIFEGKPNTKKAQIISQLLGKNEKNIKTAIEKLELKQSGLGAGYQKDLDKIQLILDKLE